MVSQREGHGDSCMQVSVCVTQFELIVQIHFGSARASL